MYARLRLMTFQLGEMAEGLIWTADPESTTFTAWVFPATTIVSRCDT